MAPRWDTSAKPVSACQRSTCDGQTPPAPGPCHPEHTLLRSEDVGFATVELRSLADWPWLEIHIKADNVDIPQEGVQKLLDFVSDVLHSERAATGFGLTYDFRLLKNPSVSGLVAIARWAAEGERKELFKQRCISCKTCVPPGWKFAATKAAMGAFFMVTPPTCTTYLMTDFDDASAQVAVFEAPEEGALQKQSSAAKVGDVRKSTSVEFMRSLTSLTSAETERSRRRRSTAPGHPAAAPGCAACFAGLAGLLTGRRRAASKDDWASGDDLRQALRRIEDLERSSQELQRTVQRQRERLDVLEAAVPWAQAMTHLGLPGKSAAAS
mmetsp:Transcript_86724/g.250278  ORF Transcript_86724/g.250278 Transcript_86724/m.250278 type:complete len:325 (-) Transcript_86724:103-1077(-)|eukprot:CAMPEP_0170311058 /NCGR_PEP_ID=MMETSP0116_2-20130129/56026_1 /TAXON_ID=400756 /ORGANISM="Durinskia baltica, Strain CSIRO CS-38" /LENGTH=324 /DNA_ID=CAMNT_0010563355 /DNA_START=56 /DNA_END=1033 /DNA_ORIENTATION=+